MKTSFTAAEVLPLIAQLIKETKPDASGFVDHDVIVAAVLADRALAKIASRMVRQTRVRDKKRAAVTMLAQFSQQCTLKRTALRKDFVLKERSNGYAYRPKVARSARVVPDIDLSAIEGDRRLSEHLRRERSPSLVRAKLASVRAIEGRIACDVCGFMTVKAFPNLDGEVCEVHHRMPLGDLRRSTRTRLEDLCVLCPSCHRAIHRTKPLMSVEDFRDQFGRTPRS